VAAFKFSETSPLPSALSANDLPGGGTKVLNVRRTNRIHHQLANSDVDSALECISDPKDQLCWNGDLDDPIESKEEWEADDKTNAELIGPIEVPEYPEQRDVSAGQDVPGSIRPTRSIKQPADNVLMMVNEMGTRRNQGTRKSRTDWVNIFTPGSMSCLTQILT